jgi:peptidoglycan/xylan/chitin deacetylase (PgdA/CDA1 family)
VIRHYAGHSADPLFRPPVGLKNPSLARVALKQKMLLVAWSLHSHDTRISDPARISRRVLDRLRAGDIVLFHDGHDLPGRHRPACAAALPAVLQGMRERGLQSVTVSQLAGRMATATGAA